MRASSPRSFPFWMVGCVLVAAALRLFRIGHQSLWIDELISLQLATYAQGADFWRGLLIDIHGPFNSAILHGWVALHQGDAWIRSLYVIPALLSIPVVYRVARELFDERAGKIAAWVLALSPFHIWYSQEVRSYSWAILWAALVLLFFVRAWDDRASRATWAGLAIFLALAVLTNFSLVFLLVTLSVLVALRRPFRSRFVLGWGGVLLFVGIVFLPWFLDWYGRIGGERMFTAGPSPMGMPLRESSGFSLAEVPYAAWSFLYGYSLGPSLRSLHLDRSLAALLPHLPVLALGAAAAAVPLLAAVGEIRGRGRGLLFLGLFGVPLLLAVFLALRDIKTFHPRYLVAAFPAFVTVLAVGWSRAGRWRFPSAGVALVLVGVALGQYYFHPAYAKEDCRSAANLILEQEASGDSVVVIYAYRPFRHYFADRGDGQARLHHVHKRFLQTDEDLRHHVAEVSDGAERVWLVLTRWWDVAPESRIRGIFEESLDEQRRWDFPGVKVTLYDEGAA